MLELRDYQTEGLDSLERYLVLATQHGARTAFIQATDRPYQSVTRLQRNDQDAGPPYVCLRIPTGGGKTLMACHAVGIAAKSFLHQDRAVCLWLVPSNTIRDQTLEALRNRTHPYHQALQAKMNSTVRVMDLGEALSISRGMLDGDTIVIVTTLQSLRRDDTEGLLVYRQNGRLMDIFGGRDHLALEGLERYEGGNETAVIPSLANALHMYRPIVIMDEAHRARTP
jgi:type III restriction enzyme